MGTDRAIPAGEEYIAALVDAAPRLSAEQRDKLAVILRFWRCVRRRASSAHLLDLCGCLRVSALDARD